MNLIAIDIGNTNIAVGLFLKGAEQSIKSVAGQDEKGLTECLKTAWEKIPLTKRSKENKRDGVIAVSSLRPTGTEPVRRTYSSWFAEEYGESKKSKVKMQKTLLIKNRTSTPG